MNAITIFDTSIRQDAEGRFSLNDLHRAAGGSKKNAPNEWLRKQQTQELAQEISKPGIPGLVSRHGGAAPGTYACRELVIAYAAWISATFHLKVIRVFLSVAAPSPQHALPPRPRPAYMREPWFLVMEMHAGQMTHCSLARALGIHESTLGQVLNGTGKYGAGTAATTRIESRVLRTFCHARRVRRTPLPRQLNLI